MASKRIAASAINWSALAERVPANQKINFGNFKSKSDIYLRAVLANPEQAPEINWDHYKKLVPIPGLVDTFKQKYEATKVPYPVDNVSSQVEAQAKETKAEVDKFIADSNQRICEHTEAIDHLKSLLPYDQMTLEDYRDAFPDDALDPIKRPTFWPHTPEEQLGYEAKDAPPPASH